MKNSFLARSISLVVLLVLVSFANAQSDFVRIDNITQANKGCSPQQQTFINEQEKITTSTSKNI